MESVNYIVNNVLPRRTGSRKTNVAQTFVVFSKWSWFIAYENINCIGVTKGVAVRDMEMNGGMEIWLYTLLSSALDEAECSVPRPD